MLHADDESVVVLPGAGARGDERRERLINTRAGGGIRIRGDPGSIHAAPIGRQKRIGRVQIRHQSLQKSGGRWILRQPVVNPLPQAQTRKEACGAQDLQVSRDTRAALPHRQGKLGHAELPLCAKSEQTQPRGLPRRPQPGHQMACLSHNLQICTYL